MTRVSRALTNGELETVADLLDLMAFNGRAVLGGDRDKLGLRVVVEIRKLCSAAELVRDAAIDDLKNRRS